MQVEQQPVALPVEITLDGKTYVVADTPELMKLVSACSVIERKKLYSTIEALKDQVKRLQNVEIVPDAPTFNEATFQEAVSKAVAAAVSPLQRELEEVRKSASQLRVESLDEYRERLIAKNHATCIPEMVKGNSKEELDAALAESIKVRSRYPSPAVPPEAYYQSVKDPNLVAQAQASGVDLNAPVSPETAMMRQVATNVATEPAPAPPATTVPSVETKELKNFDVSRMTASDYAKNRERILEELKTL